MADRRHRLAGGALLLLVACEGGYLPLRGKFDVGREPMIVFVGGPATASDLYAVSPTGGKPIPITFSAFSETRPALSPSGEAVAYPARAEAGQYGARNRLDAELLHRGGAVDRAAPPARTRPSRSGGRRMAGPSW